MRVLTFFCISLLCFGTAIAFQDETVTSYECTQVSIDDIDESLLTKEEKLRLMEKGLRKSIDSYATCIATTQSAMANSSGGASSGAEGEGNGEQSGEGEQASTNAPEQNDIGSTEKLPETEPQEPVENTPINRELSKPKDNDSIICQLLWEEIKKAPADKKAGFEKQYTDYKCG